MQVEDMLVRAAGGKDIDAVRLVAERAWRATYAGHIQTTDIDAFLSTAYSHDALASAQQRLAGGLLVAESGGRIVGYAQVGRNANDACEIFAIYVLPDAQGAGFGHGLWSAACEHARALGCSELELWVLAANERARTFYERQGARLAGERPFPLGDVTIAEARYVVSV